MGTLPAAGTQKTPAGGADMRPACEGAEGWLASARGPSAATNNWVRITTMYSGAYRAKRARGPVLPPKRRGQYAMALPRARVEPFVRRPRFPIRQSSAKAHERQREVSVDALVRPGGDVVWRNSRSGWQSSARKNAPVPRRTGFGGEMREHGQSPQRFSARSRATRGPKTRPCGPGKALRIVVAIDEPKGIGGRTPGGRARRGAGAVRDCEPGMK